MHCIRTKPRGFFGEDSEDKMVSLKLKSPVNMVFVFLTNEYVFFARGYAFCSFCPVNMWKSRGMDIIM